MPKYIRERYDEARRDSALDQREQAALPCVQVDRQRSARVTRASKEQMHTNARAEYSSVRLCNITIGEVDGRIGSNQRPTASRTSVE